MKPIYVSPSYKRAGKVHVRKLIKDVILAVHEFEVEEYREKEGGELLIIPDKLRGNMARIRNYILDECYKKSDYVLMMDDDVKAVQYFEGGKRRDMTEEQIHDFILNGFVMCEDAGWKLWGINIIDNRQAYRENLPFVTQSVVLGTFCGHIKNPLQYDERLGLKEDYDMALQHLRKYKGILRFNKYYYLAEHITMDGGCSSYRLQAEERKQIELLQRKWGDKIVRIKDTSINPIVKSPLKGV